MNIEQAMQRIHWRASAQQNYKPNPKDIEAVNFMVEWVNRQKEKTMIRHQIFAKLYVVYLGELLSHWKCIDKAQKDINSLLSESLENHIFWFREKFNILEHEKACKKLNISVNPYWTKSKLEQEKELEILENNKEYFLKHVNTWTTEKIKESLENQITEAINRYDKIT